MCYINHKYMLMYKFSKTQPEEKYKKIVYKKYLVKQYIVEENSI